MPSHGCLRTAREFSTAIQRVTAWQYWQQSWCEHVSTPCPNICVFIVNPLTFRRRHRSCNLGGKPVIFSLHFIPCLLSLMCPGPERLLLYRRRVWDYDCTVSELRACTMSSDNYCASALFLLHSQRHRSALLHLTLLSLPGRCSAVIYSVPCRNLLTLLLQTPLHTYLSSNSFPPQITNRAPLPGWICADILLKSAKIFSQPLSILSTMERALYYILFQPLPIHDLQAVPGGTIIIPLKTWIKFAWYSSLTDYVYIQANNLLL